MGKNKGYGTKKHVDAIKNLGFHTFTEKLSIKNIRLMKLVELC